MKVSIVIPVRNERDTAIALIERVRAVDCGMEKELIVVDGASTDGTREALEAYAGVDPAGGGRRSMGLRRLSQ